jgi:hypothetical protein
VADIIKDEVDATIPNPPSSRDGPTQSEPGKPPSSGGRTLGLGGLLIELVLPVAFSAALLLVLASYTAYWDLHTPIGLGIFGLLLLALSLFVSIRVDRFTLARRKERGRKQLLNRANARARLVKFVLGGLVIPMGALAAANLLELPNHQTPMSLAIRLSLGKPPVARAEQLGNAVLRAESSAARVQGIVALQTMRSGEALDQLLRILSDDPAALKGGSEYQALSKALASYGAPAKLKLRQRFDQVSPGARRGAAAPPGDLFERYFAAGFEGVKSEIDGRSPDPGAEGELERLQAARAELKRALSQVESETPSAQGGSPLPAFIMQTFLQMGLQQDPDLLAFARRTAVDAEWSDAVRGQALLLIAKLGGNDDLDGLYAYLESPSALLRTRATQAIATLQSRLSGAATSG